MAKSFLEALEEWKNDNRYQIEEDIGWEFADDYESSPMLDERSLTTDNGTTAPTKTVFDSRTPS
jgi:hypothetical protein